MDGFEEVVPGGGDHDGNGDEEGELERGGARHAGELAGGDGAHGAGGAGKDGGEDLAEADPDGLAHAHLIDVLGLGIVAAAPGVDGPHEDTADEEGELDDAKAFEVLADDLLEQKSGDGGADEGDQDEGEGMGEDGVVAALPAREGAHKGDDAAEEEQNEGEDGAELDDDCVHLPVGVSKRDVEQGLREAEMGRGADGKKLGQAFHNAKQNRDDVVVQTGTLARARALFAIAAVYRDCMLHLVYQTGSACGIVGGTVLVNQVLSEIDGVVAIGGGALLVVVRGPHIAGAGKAPGGFVEGLRGARGVRVFVGELGVVAGFFFGALLRALPVAA